jgi:hypothetical protein
MTTAASQFPPREADAQHAATLIYRAVIKQNKDNREGVQARVPAPLEAAEKSRQDAGATREAAALLHLPRRLC